MAPGTKIHGVLESCASSPRRPAVEQSLCPHSHRIVNNFGEFRNEYEGVLSAESPAVLPLIKSPTHRVRLSVFQRTNESNWVNNTKGRGTLDASDQKLSRRCWLSVRLLAQVPPHGFGQNYQKRDKQIRTNEERSGVITAMKTAGS